MVGAVVVGWSLPFSISWKFWATHACAAALVLKPRLAWRVPSGVVYRTRHLVPALIVYLSTLAMRGALSARVGCAVDRILWRGVGGLAR